MVPLVRLYLIISNAVTKLTPFCVEFDWNSITCAGRIILEIERNLSFPDNVINNKFKLKFAAFNFRCLLVDGVMEATIAAAAVGAVVIGAHTAAAEVAARTKVVEAAEVEDTPLTMTLRATAVVAADIKKGAMTPTRSLLDR